MTLLRDLLKRILPPSNEEKRPIPKQEEPPKPEIKPLSPVKKRVIEGAVYHAQTEEKDILYQHSVLCQNSIPYRNPGNDLDTWEQRNGDCLLAIQALKAEHPKTRKLVHVGLPYGGKARLIFGHLNRQALINESPIVEVEESMTAFVKSLGVNDDGRTMAEIKNQLARLSVSVFTMAWGDGNRSIQQDTKLIKAFDVWYPKDADQKVLWSSTVQLSDDYFNSLASHAIPLSQNALAALTHAPMAMDIYSWLGQRLHRIPLGKPQFVSWQNLKDQFGHGYGRIDHFKAKFRALLVQALLQYPEARHSVVEKKNEGFMLHHAPPPIPKKLYKIGSIGG